MENNNTSTKQYKFRTYFDNNLLVMKDKTMLCILLKLFSLYQLNYNKEKKHGKPTNNVKFQFSINEFIIDLQISKNTVIEKMKHLEKMKLITKTKTKDDNNANGKNEYQFNANLLEEIVSKLNPLSRKERKKYINEIFDIPKKENKEKENKKPVEAESEQEEKSIPLTPAEIEKEKNIKANEKLDQLQRQEAAELKVKFQQREKEKIRKSEINTNNTLKSTSIEKPTPTTTEEAKMAPKENKEVEEQSISNNNTNEYEKNNVQLALINLLNNDELFLFSNEFRNCKMYLRIIDCLESKDYHSFLMNAYAKDGFYTLSKDYLNEFNEKDRTTLLNFINCYIQTYNNVEVEAKNIPAV